jgi:hypothetical protein
MKRSITTTLLLVLLLIGQSVIAQPNILWSRNYGWHTDGYAQRLSYSPEEGCLLITGVTYQYDGDEGFNNQTYPFVMSVDGSGETEWTLEGEGASANDAPAVSRQPWGAYLVLSASKPTEENSAYSLSIKNLDIETNEYSWERSVFIDDQTSIRAVSSWEVPGDGDRAFIFGYKHAASWDSQPSEDRVFVMTITSEGDIETFYHLPGTEGVILTGVQRMVDGGFLLVGRIGPAENVGGGRAFAMKITWEQEIEWSITLEGEGEDRVTGVAPFVGGFYLLCSSLDVELEIDQTYVIKLTNDGEQLWRRSIGGEWRTSGQAIARTTGEELWIGGSCILPGEIGPQKAWLAGIDEDGDLLWQEQYGGWNYGRITAIARTSQDNGAYIAGHGSYDGVPNGNGSIWLMKAGSFPNSVADRKDRALPTGLKIESLAPNPFNSMSLATVVTPFTGQLQASLVDMSGRQWSKWTVSQAQPGVGRFVITGVGLASGPYWLKVEQAGRMVGMKVVLIK